MAGLLLGLDLGLASAGIRIHGSGLWVRSTRTSCFYTLQYLALCNLAFRALPIKIVSLVEISSPPLILLISALSSHARKLRLR